MTKVNVSRNHKTGDYLIQRYAGMYGVGRFVEVSAAEMQKAGLGIILKCLQDEPPPKTGEKPQWASFSKDEERDFYRQHHHVSVDLASREVIAICPMRRKGSGFVTPRDEVIELSLPCTNDQFLDALNRAYAEL